MKRFWIGIVMLGVLSAGSIAMLLFSHSFYDAFSETLESAADAALSGQWSEAEKLSQQAKMQWSRSRRFFASFTDHEPVEDVQLLFMKLELYQQAQRTVDFADACKSLAHLCEAIDESHNLNWWSVL